jgi:multidrug resistance efflux pump
VLLALLWLIGCGDRPATQEETGISGTGTLEGKSVAVVSELGGLIRTIPVAEGDQINAGDRVVVLDDADARTQVAQARAAVAAAQANLDDLRAGERPAAHTAAQAALDAAEIRVEQAAQAVTSAREAITQPVTLDLKIAEARLNRDVAEQGVEQAEAEFAAEALNYHIYVDLKDVSDQTRRSWDLRTQAARANITQAEADLDAAQADLNALLGIRANPLEAMATLHGAQATYTATLFAAEEARARLEVVQDGARPEEIEIAEALLAQAQAGLDMALIQQSMLTLTAPITGIVTTRHDHAGELAVPGRPILTLTKLDVLQLTLYVPETRITDVRLGQTARVTVEPFPGEVFTGTVQRIATEAEYTPRTLETEGDRARRVFAVDIQLPNPERRLQPGLPARGQITLKP